jgi:hypothetical protein
MMKVRPLVVLSFVFAAALVAAACGTPTSATTVSTVVVSGGVPGVGGSSQFSAVATLSGGTSQDVTGAATWASSNTAVATVSGTGLVVGVSAGTAVITATYSGVAGTDSITVP